MPIVMSVISDISKTKYVFYVDMLQLKINITNYNINSITMQCVICLLSGCAIIF